MTTLPAFSVSDFVAILNQTLEYAYSSVTIHGELANFKISKGRWLYFDLKDDFASVRFFGNVNQMPGPLQDGMLLKVHAQPRLHPQFGFSLQVQMIELSGEGTIKKAAKLLEAKLQAEGLFAVERKRSLPYPPATIGLVTSGESAAYVDFTKILNQRWGGIEIRHVDVQVQGEQAPSQIVAAINFLNAHQDPPEVIVVTRGGGSADDLQTFSTEQVTRAVAASRIPTLVAIGHEVDSSLAERAADVRASTPSNAAEILVPDKKHEHANLKQSAMRLTQLANALTKELASELQANTNYLHDIIIETVSRVQNEVGEKQRLLHVLSPQAALTRGYALIRHNGAMVTSRQKLKQNDEIDVLLLKQELHAKIISAKRRIE